jgi:hypothetical protein
MKNRLARFTSFAFFVVLAGMLTMSCSGNKESGEANEAGGNLPVFTLQEDSTYDFGKVKDGEIVEKSFAFKNTGDGPLVIGNISASCGCTTPEWPKEPIAPGAESNIMVRFNTTGKPGPQNKTVTITANTEPSVIELHVKGIVEGK